jgi:hypothetical protein
MTPWFIRKMLAWYANGTNKALRECLRKEWELPKEHKFKDTGHEWVLLLLNKCIGEVRSKQLFTWWRSCHMRNNTIFFFAMGNIL